METTNVELSEQSMDTANEWNEADLEMLEEIIETTHDKDAAEGDTKQSPNQTSDHKDMIAALEERIAFLERKLLDKGSLGPKAQKLAEINRVHDRRALIGNMVRVFLVFLVTASVFLYEYTLYADPEHNTLSQTAIQHIHEISIPFIYINGAYVLSLVVLMQSVFILQFIIQRFEEHNHCSGHRHPG